MKRWCLLAILITACGGDDGGGIGSDGGPGDGPGGSPTDGGGGGGSDGAVDAAAGVGEPTELMGITLFHNQVRAMVQTTPALPALAWNPSLAATAAAWVAQCIDNDNNGLIDHNPNRSNGHPYYVGENVYASSGTATAQGAVDLWAAEKSNYNYANNSCSGVCGHYTQIVWRDTVELGCALGTCNSLQYKSVIVCNYGPGGNVNGARPY